jgi:hypothetical protein
MPPRIHASCSTWGDPKTALAPQNWGTREFRFPPELGGENRLLQEVYSLLGIEDGF